MKILKFCLSVFIYSPLITCSLHCTQQPPLKGSFRETCHNCHMDKRLKTMTCLCANNDGWERTTTVSKEVFQDCPDDLRNINGHLRCNPKKTPSTLKNL